MPGYQFLFSAALWALPLAGLPVLLHLLFKRKSPVVPFPTLRFIRSSVRHTAARRRVRRWLLLACRALLLALLVWAVAQPARTPAAGASAAGAGRSVAAVIVVDTSYSMELQDGGSTLLARADAAVRALLNGRLRGARVAVFRSSLAPADRPDAEELRRQERFRPSGDVKWTPLTPQPAPRPLVDRVAAAADMLDREQADERWLVVVSDLQRRDFPRALPEFKGGRTVLIDLHAEGAAPSAAVVQLGVQPEQPTPGIRTDLICDVLGRANEARQVNVAVTALDDGARTELPPMPANFDGTGRARVRSALQVPPKGWVRVDASLTAAEPLAWARQRSLLLQVPPRQAVTVVAPPELAAAAQRVAWALDPSEGRATAWPLAVKVAADVAPDATVAVVLLSDWPDSAQARRLLDFVRRGNTLVWFVRPGLEQTWGGVDGQRQALLAELLPGVPSPNARVAPVSTVAVVAPQDPVLAGLTDERYQIQSITTERLVPFEPIAPRTTPLLNAVPETPGPGRRTFGLAFRRAVGRGTAFTFATLPERRFSTIYRNPTFPPMLVQMALRPPGRGDAQNVEVGEVLAVTGTAAQPHAELRVRGPQGDVTVVKPATDGAGGGAKRFAFDRTETPGQYTWRGAASEAVVAVGNVQPPAAEAELAYAPAASLVPTGDGAANVVVTRSVAELEGRLTALAQPEPRWALPVGIVMVLMCFEALMGSVGGLSKPGGAPAFVPGVRGAA